MCVCGVGGGEGGGVGGGDYGVVDLYVGGGRAVGIVGVGVSDVGLL